MQVERDHCKNSQDKGNRKLSYEDDADVGSLVAGIFATIVVAAAALAAAVALFLSALLLSKAASLQWPLHHLLSAIVIALSNNVDNLGARLAYSVQGTKVHLLINAWISFITLVISTSAAYLGVLVISLLGKNFASLLSMAMLVTLGLWMIFHARLQSWHDRIHEEKKPIAHAAILKKPHHADVDDSKHIDFGEGTILGVALSINNIGGGVTAGVLGVAPLLVGFLSALISFAALIAGNHAADFFIKRRISDKAAFLGGIAMILIGLKQLF